MVRRTLSNIRKWMLTKAILVAAVIYFVVRLPKTLNSMLKQRETELKNKTQQKTVVTGSSEEEAHEATPESSSGKENKLEFSWDIPGEEIPQLSGKEDIESLIQKIESAGANQSVDMREVEDALQKILDADWGDDVMQEMIPPTPVHILDLGKDCEYLFSVQRRTFVPVPNKIEVIPIDTDFSVGGSSNFYLINNEVFDIDKDKVVCVGWN